MVKYFKPETLAEALELMKDGSLLPYAGGTDINSAGITGRDLLFIGKLSELRQIRKDGEFIRIGACVTYDEASRSELTPLILKEAIRKVAGPAIRNAGTFGGNFANGSGKADCALVNMVLGAKLLVRSVRGERMVDTDKFYRGRKNIDLMPDELICEILIPDKEYYVNYLYDKISVRTSVAISNISLASVWKIENGRIAALAIGIGSATECPMRCTDMEDALIGKTLEEVEHEREDILVKFVTDLRLQPDRTEIAYRRQVCYRLLNYLMYEEFTPIRL